MAGENNTWEKMKDKRCKKARSTEILTKEVKFYSIKSSSEIDRGGLRKGTKIQ
jgi:hypothetical protein